MQFYLKNFTTESEKCNFFAKKIVKFRLITKKVKMAAAMKYHQMKALLVRRKGGKIHLGGKLHDRAINR